MWAVVSSLHAVSAAPSSPGSQTSIDFSSAYGETVRITQSAGEGDTSADNRDFFHCWTCQCILSLLQLHTKPAESFKLFPPAVLSKIPF